MTETLNLLPTVPASTVANLPAEARYVDHYSARLRTKFGIRPVALYVFEVLGESGFLVADGDENPHLCCGRCGGYGEYSYNSMDGTMCYGCNGDGLGKSITWEDAIRIAKRRIADAKRAERIRVEAMWADAQAYDALHEKAADVLRFLADKRERNGFLGDVARKVADKSFLSDRQIEAVRGIIAKDAQRTETRAAAGHFGTVGKREKAITAKVIRTVELPDYGFGISWLIIMETPEGHALVTKTSGAFADVEAGETYTFAGTPKEHGEYKGEPQTSLTRCALPKPKA